MSRVLPAASGSKQPAMERLERLKAKVRCSCYDGHRPAGTRSKLVCVPALSQWQTAALSWFQLLCRSCSWSVGTGVAGS